MVLYCYSVISVIPGVALGCITWLGCLWPGMNVCHRLTALLKCR